MDKPLTIVAVSNMLGDVFDCALLLGYRVARIVLNQPEVVRERTLGLADRLRMLPEAPEVVDIANFRPVADEACFVGTTSPARAALVDELATRFGLRCVSLVHPSAVVSRFARIGHGVFVGAGSVIGPNVMLGEHAFINRGVTVGHDTRVGAYARLQPGCNVGGHVEIGAGVLVGMGACVIEELVVGEGSTVTAGAVVTRDVPPGSMVAGARALTKARGERLAAGGERPAAGGEPSAEEATP